MKLKKFHSKGILYLIALIVINMIVGSLAYWTQSEQAVNEFQTALYSTELVEEFTPPSDWKPGQNVNKDAKVTNQGTVPVFARITLSQEWIRRENVYDKNGQVIAPAKGENFSLTFDGNQGKEYAALIQWGENVVLLSSGKSSTESLNLGLNTVDSVEQAVGKWLLISETPDQNNNLTLYYIGVVQGGTETPLVLDSVTMNPNIQSVIVEEDTVWNKQESKWVTTTTTNPTHDYQNAHYTLGVKMETVQATKQAMKEMFGSDMNSTQTVINYLESVAVLGKGIDFSRDNQVKEKRLFLAENSGKLTYIPSAPNENWFMSHLNMIPGESYEDNLTIENQTDNDYTIYMQVVPKNGYTDGLPKELLELIHMNVYHDGQLIYNGTAWGKEYNGSINNLQNVISLGDFGAKRLSNIRVELTLSKDTPIEYGGLLTQIDWKWMVEEDITPTPPDDPSNPNPSTPPNPPSNPKTPTPPKSGPSPKTGDIYNMNHYIIFMTVTGTALVGCIVCYVILKRKNRYSEDNENIG